MITLPTLNEADYARAIDDPCKTEAGFGALRTQRGLLPLEALEVDACLDGLVAAVEVRQTFVNNHDEPLEATYIFPLPDRAAVTGFRLEVAGRIIEGDLQERGKARQQYDQAIRAGHRAAIAEEERPGVFTMRVGNLPPGERARVRLTLAGPLPYRDGEVTFRFPLVVAPRYVPGVPLSTPPVGAGIAPDTTAVPDASRISPPVLLHGFPSPVRLAIHVDVPSSELAPRDFHSSLHTVVEDEHGGRRRFRLQPGEKLDRDFVLRYRLGDNRVQTSLVVRPDAKGDAGTFLLTIVPPALALTRQRPRDIVFVLDRSGSMSGWKMVAARRAVSRMVETLTDEDGFTIYAFDDSIETPPGFDGLSLTPASDRRRFQAAEFLAAVNDRGGTEMAEPLYRAVQELNRGGAKPERDRILVLITDGQVGNEDHILKRIGQQVRGLRIFTLGIDQAVNAGFLRRLADLGGGASEVVESEARLDAVMDSVHRHIGTAVLTGLELRPGGFELLPDSLVPARLPDLFAGSPVLIAGRYQGRECGAVVVQARDAAGKGWSAETQARREEKAPLGAIWGRGRVRELEDRYVIGGDLAKLEQQIVETSLRFGVLSRFTAYVAVDRSEVVHAGGEQKQLVQPVEAPAGWGQHETLSMMRCAQPAAAMLSGGRGAFSPPGYASRAVPGRLDAGDASCDFKTESVDSFLMEFAAPDAAETMSAPAALGAVGPTARSQDGGLVKRLVSALFGTKEQADIRPQVEALKDLLLDGGGADSASRWATLVNLHADLTALVKHLRQAGDADASVAEMEKVAEKVEQLRAQPQPPDNVIEELYGELSRALESWLRQAPPVAGKAFWK